MPRLAFLLLVLGLAAPTCTLAAGEKYEPNAERGRALYENHCRFCHTERIHARPQPLPMTRDEVQAIVDHFRRMQNLAWTYEEVDDVTEYLNRSRYLFPRKP